MLGEPLHLAVLAFAETKREPDIGALLAVDTRLDWPVSHAVDGDACAQAMQRLFAHPAMRAHAVAPEPTSAWQLEMPREPTVGGKQQEALRVDVEASDRNHARQIWR